MSKLKTIVPVDAQAVIRSLPPKSFVHSVELNADKTGIEIVWDNDAIKTGRTYPVEYPLEKIIVNSPMNNDKVVDKPFVRGKKVAKV